jgi:exodeoxyribonuclease VII large subunit
MTQPTAPKSTPGQREVLTVSQLNREARAVLEGNFPLLWIEGELSNLARPTSGHLYFTLKDEFAQVRCAMFRMRNTNLRFRPQNGMHVLMRARIGLYEPRGDFQLIVDHMEEAGDGALRRAFEELKNKLEAEGLFETARKRPVPPLPRCIGVVTSPSGAAIRDVLTVLQRRFPAIPVIIYPVPVQGAGAGGKIAAAIRRAGGAGDCDVLIVGRGGGSLEDLWPFNEEVVARAVFDSPVPVVSAVGHEIDFTISDFVADVRAPTPSAAAELLSPDRLELEARLAGLKNRLVQCTARELDRQRRHLDWLARRLKHPGRRLEEIAQRLDELDRRMARALEHRIRHRRARLAELQARLARHNPSHRLEQLQNRRAELDRRLRESMGRMLERRRYRVAAAARALDTVSPLATLSRGYAIVSRDDGQIVRHHDEVKAGDCVQARIADGRLLCRVEETYGKNDKD